MHSSWSAVAVFLAVLGYCHGQSAQVTGSVANIPRTGQCPGGPSLPIHCDPKRPWPTCPPQSYCYATNSVDVGPYFCCPVWSTYGSPWRPTGPAFNYVPPPPSNWPPAITANTNWPSSAVGTPNGYQQQATAQPAQPQFRFNGQKFRSYKKGEDNLDEQRRAVESFVSEWIKNRKAANK